MIYREYLRRFVGKRGQFIYEEGRCEITFYVGHIDAVMVGDLCNLTGPLGQSIFCETDPSLKSTEGSNDCRIIKVHDDFVLVECASRKGSKDIKAVPFDSLITTVLER
jgi:hypothetical protein